MNQKEKTLLLKLQSDFPLVPRPYQEIGKKFGMTEKEVIDKLKNFKKKGIIRYIGGAFNLKKLGIKSTLIALSVPKKNLQKTVNIINAYPNVSHNYLRQDKFNLQNCNNGSRFNLWFTVSSRSKKKLLNIVNEIKKKTKSQNMLNLMTLKVFKIDARFKI